MLGWSEGEATVVTTGLATIADFILYLIFIVKQLLACVQGKSTTPHLALGRILLFSVPISNSLGLISKPGGAFSADKGPLPNLVCCF